MKQGWIVSRIGDWYGSNPAAGVPFKAVSAGDATSAQTILQGFGL